MSSKNTFVALFLIGATLLCTLVLDKAAAMGMAYANVANTEVLGQRFTVSTAIGLAVSAIIAVWVWIHAKSRRFLGEVVEELAKVSWPEWSETKVNTVVVIVFSFIAAAILGLFDLVFAELTSRIL